MDSPSEFSAFTLRTFTVPTSARTPVFRLAVHHDGTDAELDALARDVEAIVREARHVFGEYPAVRGQHLHVHRRLPAVGQRRRDGAPQQHDHHVAVDRCARTALDLLDTISHEFFHSWNVERIRPKSLEPFNFEDANMSGELWLAEGFTNYYGR